MKHVLYLLLMIWFALQATVVQAHMVQESLHQSSHAAQFGDKQAADVDHGDSCLVVVCSHTFGVFYTHTKLCCDPVTSLCLPTAVRLYSDPPRNDIERPKWPTAAPLVAGI